MVRRNLCAARVSLSSAAEHHISANDTPRRSGPVGGVGTRTSADEFELPVVDVLGERRLLGGRGLRPPLGDVGSLDVDESPVAVHCARRLGACLRNEDRRSLRTRELGEDAIEDVLHTGVLDGLEDVRIPTEDIAYSHFDKSYTSRPAARTLFDPM